MHAAWRFSLITQTTFPIAAKDSKKNPVSKVLAIQPSASASVLMKVDVGAGFAAPGVGAVMAGVGLDVTVLRFELR